jgi:hypothetical protein
MNGMSFKKSSLTDFRIVTILYSLSQKTKAGIETPRNQGPKRPRSNVVFLCPSKTLAALCRLNSVMAGCIGQPLKRLAGSLAGSLNPIQSATQRLRPKGGGLSLYQGVSAMRHYAQNPAIPSQNPNALTLAQNAMNELKNIIKLAGELQEEIYQTGDYKGAYLGLNRISKYALDADDALLQLRSILREGC